MRTEGFEDVRRKLLAMPEEARGKLLRAALREAAEPIRQSVASHARRAPGAPDLADHIVISTARTENDAAISIGPSRELRSDQPHRQFDTQARMLEFGTRRMAAFPFMRPAFDSESESAAQSLTERIWAKLVEVLR